MKEEFLYDVNKLKDNEKILYGDKEVVLSLTKKVVINFLFQVVKEVFLLE